MFDNKQQTFIVQITFLGGFIWMMILLVNSSGTHLHDEIGHFLISRDALHAPAHLFDTWGRTLNTLLYIIPAQFGLGAARFLSLLFALLTAFLALKVAQAFQLKYAFLVPLLLWCQPWFADLSYLCITQVPFSLIMIGGIYVYLKNHRISAACIIGLLPLIRHEGIALIGLASIYLLIKRDWVSAGMVFAPLIVYNIVYFSFQGIWPFLLYFDSKPNNIYGSGTWYHFLIRLPHPRAVGIPVMLLIACAIIPLFKGMKQNAVLKAVIIWYVLYFLLHTVIYRFGLFASGGYKLFLLPLAPVLALSSAVGLEWITEKLESNILFADKSATSRSPLTSALCIGCVLFALINVKPHTLDELDRAVKGAADWARNENIDKKHIIATHVFFYYFLPMTVPVKTLWEKFPPLSELPPGTIVVWDNKYSDMWDLKSEYFTGQPGTWEKVTTYGDDLVVIYRKIGQRDTI